MSDAIAGLAALVHLLPVRQNSTPRLTSPFINGNGIYSEQLFVELREIDERRNVRTLLLFGSSGLIPMMNFSIHCVPRY